jgi:hypothetical protein
MTLHIGNAVAKGKSKETEAALRTKTHSDNAPHDLFRTMERAIPCSLWCFMDCSRGQASMRTCFRKSLRRPPCAAHKFGQQKLERRPRASPSHGFRTILADKADV